MSRREVEWPDCTCMGCGEVLPARHVCLDMDGTARGGLTPPKDWQTFQLNTPHHIAVQVFVCTDCVARRARELRFEP